MGNKQTEISGESFRIKKRLMNKEKPAAMQYNGFCIIDQGPSWCIAKL